jgi:iron complex outermembrane receptor protein
MKTLLTNAAALNLTKEHKKMSLNFLENPRQSDLARSLGRLLVTGAVAIGGIAAAQIASAQTAPSAQNADQNDEGLSTVVVTGSHIRRTDTESPSPLEVISAEKLRESGFTSTAQVLSQLTANSQGTLSQSFTGAFATGASGIALRGLNVGYTLILIDGHRSAPYPIGDDGQRSFVDTSSIPFDSIERIEILKDGASAIYGSDAIAGVVNVILKKAYTGATVTADAGTSVHADGTTEHVAATWGRGDLDADGHNFFVSGEFRNAQQIRFLDRGGIFENTDYTSIGGVNLTPGVPTNVNGGIAASTTGYVTDVATNSQILAFMPGCNATAYNAGQCAFKNTSNLITPPTSNYNALAKYTQKLGGDWTLALQGTYFESKAENGGGNFSASGNGNFNGIISGPGVIPSVGPTTPQTIITSANPSFPQSLVQQGITSGFLHYTLANLGPLIDHTDAKTYRAIADLDGKIADWDFNGSVGFTDVRLKQTWTGTVNPGAFEAALNDPTDPFLIGVPNNATVMNEVSPAESSVATSQLVFAHAGVTHSIAQLPGGPLGLALGADYFIRRQDLIAPPDAESGVVRGVANTFTVGDQHVAAGYMELDAPVVKSLDIDAAVRYDHYNLSGGKASPKIGFKWTPIPEFAIRGTASRGFRAPSPAENGLAGQTFLAAASNDPVLCPHPNNPTAAGNFLGTCSVSFPGQQSTNPDLKSETSKSFTFGFVVEPTRYFSASMDLYSIKIENQIESGGSGGFVRSTSLTPIPQFQPNGTLANVAPPVGLIIFFPQSFINANSTYTNGWDMDLDFHYNFDNGVRYKSTINWTYIHELEFNINGQSFQLAGTHAPSFFTGDTGTPKSRAAWSNTIGVGGASLTATVNYISSFSVIDTTLIAFEGVSADTCAQSLANQGGAASAAFQNIGTSAIPGGASCNVNHFTTVDLFGKYDVTPHLNLHGSITNLFNSKAPLDWGTYASVGIPFNPSMHVQGAIGMFFNVGATYTF